MTNAFLMDDTLEDGTTVEAIVIEDDKGNQTSVRLVDALLIANLEESDPEGYAQVIELMQLLLGRPTRGGLSA